MPATARIADLIAAVGAAGGTIRRDGDNIELTAPRPLPADLVARIRAAKPALLAALAEVPDWQARHREALSHWGALHSADEAARLAWGELQGRWHRLHGEHLPEWQCAGCGRPIGGFPSLGLADGNRVHLDDAHGFRCIIAYGERWRGAATLALVKLGLKPPAEERA
jgi:hypothetical protein